ncbi:hypothetical protein A2118_03195 [Candidatus Kaiserbacteria bacterium GWA2_50_9]|uniref:Uncharacterized protein n=1 Tax=Candidatus Kaiserbacteria bacterium GWA2_50_9 TaxID=1798474 RepID=A0A1F6BRU4_9BACT|nr:MAG: hypothetical protein A2118_03195 [Candidatus Kaiserbacteria bacterium GWA2_50_9]
MNDINLEKSWESIITKTHSAKPNRGNLPERETLLASQVLLGQYELARSEKNKELIKFYTDVLETYEKHGINGHIVWEK